MTQSTVKKVLAFFALAALFGTPLASVQAAYPPAPPPPPPVNTTPVRPPDAGTVFTPGTVIQAPVTVTIPGATAVIPVAKSPVAPQVTKPAVLVTNAASPVDGKSIISNSQLAKTPVELAKGVIFGGVKSSQMNLVPIATVKAGSKVEVQVLQDVPVRLKVTDLPQKTTAVVKYVGDDGKVIVLGKLAVSASGQIILPPLLLKDAKISGKIVITTKGTDREIPIRSTK